MKRDGLGGVAAAGYETTGPNGTKRLVVVAQEDVTFPGGVLYVDTAGTLLVDMALIEAVTCEVIVDVTGVAIPTQVLTGDPDTDSRFRGGMSTLTAGSKWFGGDHLSGGSISMRQLGNAPVRLTADQIPDGGVIRVTVWSIQYVI
jgi:hypothetical protein